MIVAKNNLTVGSLFAGIGGICLGFKKAGCDVVWANEIDEKACQTYRHNYPDTDLYGCDIHTIVSPRDLGEIDILTSGFPCQAFSVAGYRQGFDDEKGRGNLFFETARFIEDIKPKAFLLENVKNLVTHDKGNTFRVIRKTIVEDLGYSFIPFVLNSKEFGNVPQTRERIYVVGFRNEAEYSLDLGVNPSTRLQGNLTGATPKFTIPERIPLSQTIADVLVRDKVDEAFYYRDDHKYYPALSEAMVSQETVYQWRRVYVRENKSNVCPTLTANMGTGGHNVPLILTDDGIRKLTPRECLRFQGFPDTFEFPEGMAKSHCYKQAGNSVVVPVIERIAESIVSALNDI